MLESAREGLQGAQEYSIGCMDTDSMDDMLFKVVDDGVPVALLDLARIQFDERCLLRL